MPWPNNHDIVSLFEVSTEDLNLEQQLISQDYGVKILVKFMFILGKYSMNLFEKDGGVIGRNGKGQTRYQGDGCDSVDNRQKFSHVHGVQWRHKLVL